MRENKHNSMKIYTLVSSGADADRGFFPAPEARGSYLSLGRARMELFRLVNEEKKGLDGRYDREERGEDHWEAFADGYAAACFSRIEILASQLCLTAMDEEGFCPAGHLEQRAECQDAYGVPCRKDGEGECGLSEDARDDLEGVAAEERAALPECMARLNAQFCTCPERASDDLVEAMLYVHVHMEEDCWRLQYTTLTDGEKKRLCRIGKCRVCGKVLCEGEAVETAATPEALFEAVWAQLQRRGRFTRHAALLAHPLCAEELYVSLFHAEDRSAAQQWYRVNVSGVAE